MKFMYLLYVYPTYTHFYSIAN